MLKPFSDWAAELQQLPSPLLLHPAGYQAGGFDVNDPDFLPPDPSFGTTADFSAMIAAAHRLGDLVMPYGNLSWWDPSSPTMQSLPAGVQTKDVAVLDALGNPVTISYGDHTGVIVSPYSAVRAPADRAVHGRLADEGSGRLRVPRPARGASVAARLQPGVADPDRRTTTAGSRCSRPTRIAA